MNPMMWFLVYLAPLFFMFGLHELGWQPHIQQIGDYLVGKGLAILAGTFGMWFILNVLDRIFPGDWFKEIMDDPVSVRWVTCAVVLAVGVIVAWS